MNLVPNLLGQYWAFENRPQNGSNKLGINKLRSEISSDNKSSTDKLARSPNTKDGVHWVSHKRSRKLVWNWWCREDHFPCRCVGEAVRSTEKFPKIK